MKQQVNLYQNLAQKPRFVLEAKRIFLIYLAVIVLLFLISLYAQWQYSHYKKEVAQLRQSISDTEKAIAKVGENPRIAKQKLLAQKVSSLSKTIQEKQSLIKTLQHSKASNTLDFSGYFTALARHTVPGIWLTKISVQHAGKLIILQGHATSSGLLPEYLRALRGANSFSGRVTVVSKVAPGSGKQGFLKFTVQSSEQ